MTTQIIELPGDLIGARRRLADAGVVLSRVGGSRTWAARPQSYLCSWSDGSTSAVKAVFEELKRDGRLRLHDDV